MAGGDGLHADDGQPSRRRALRVTGWLVVLALLAAAAYVLATDSRLGVAPDPAEDPAAVPPPAGLDLPEVGEAEVVADELADQRLRPQAVRRALGSLTDSRRLGQRVGVVVAGMNGRPVLREGPTVLVPASTMKLLTALAALESVGPDQRFATRVVIKARQLTLVGGGDPLLGRRPSRDDYPPRADIRTLARRVASALGERRGRFRLAYDDGLFTGPAENPDWEPDYVPDFVVSPVSALWIDEGRRRPGGFERSADPARAAAKVFRAELLRAGVPLTGSPVSAPAPPRSHELASVDSAPLIEIVQHVLETSDNEAAEVLARHVAVAEGRPASFQGAASAVRDVLSRLGVRMQGAVILDGSGLARGNRLSLRTLLDVLALAASGAGASGGVMSGLPVAGFTGSLSYRFTEGPPTGLGRVRAKTGTLTGVHGLAGVVTGRDGSVMLFAVIADRVKERNTLFARDRLDRISSALAACSCS